ncbi:hypothetical protein WMF18_40145 [Sorangium sp. So ce315]
MEGAEEAAGDEAEFWSVVENSARYGKLNSFAADRSVQGHCFASEG